MPTNNKTVSHIKIVSSNHTSSSKKDLKNKSPSGGWTVQQTNKRNQSDPSPTSSPITTNQQSNKEQKKIFSMRNKFEVLAQNNNTENNSNMYSNCQFDNVLNNNNTTTIEQINTDSPKFPSSLSEALKIFPAVCEKLIEIIEVENIVYKSFTERLKIQTSNPAAYRTHVHFLKDEEYQYHTYQLQQDKPTKLVLRNLHPTTPISLIKDEFELRLFEMRCIKRPS